MELLVKAISLHQGNLTRVARDLEVSRSTLYRKLRTYGLDKFVPAATPLSSNSRLKPKKQIRPSTQESESEMSPESTSVVLPLEPLHHLPQSV